MDIKSIEVTQLRHPDYNPRKLTKKKEREIRESLTEFGLVQPLVVNMAKGREGIIIGGNQRFDILVKDGHTMVDCVVVEIEDLEREKELNLRLNKNEADWDKDKLKLIDEFLLRRSGFDDAELNRLFIERRIVDGEEVFTVELYEANNYVMFVFNDEIDWNFVEDRFKLRPVLAKDTKANYVRKGVGRVLGGEKLLEVLR